MREVTHAQKVRLGVFLIVSVVLLLSLMIIVTGTRIFEQRDFYFVRYRDMSVSGLEKGAQVKYHGVRVGRVEKIFIDPEEIETIVVSFSLEHGTPVTEDVKAVITAMSLTGLKIIELEGGTSQAAPISPDSEIPAGESTLQMITGSAEAVSEKLEIVLSNLIAFTSGENQQQFMTLVANTSTVLSDFHLMLEDNRQPLANTIGNLETASEGLRDLAMSEEIRRTFANLDSTAANIRAAQIGDAVTDLRYALVLARTTFGHLDLTLLKGRHDLLTSLEVLRESLDSFNEFARMISEDPSLLLRGTREGEISGAR